MPKSKKKSNEITSTLNIPGIELIMDLTAIYQLELKLTLSPSFLEIILRGLKILSILRALINFKSTPVKNILTS
jgi:hypothetical protein